MYGTLNRVKAQNAKAKLTDSYNQLLAEISDISEKKTVGNYSIIRLIAKGSFGKVYLAVHKFTRTKVVLKSSSKDQPNLVREIHHHRRFNHPHIARLYEIIVTESQVWMALEYCQGEELYDYLVSHGRLSQDEVKKVFSELCGAVAYTHFQGCAHRDIKLENALLDKDHNVKLCDFGFTRDYMQRGMLETVCGTTCYMAPEMLQRKHYSGPAVDVWSLGVILYTLNFGELPFEEDSDLDTRTKIVNEEPSYPDPSVPEPAVQLIRQMLSKDPRNRPNVEQVLSHPYLEEYANSQRGILASKPVKPFSTKAEKRVLRSLKSANFDVSALVESVNSQACDSLAGLWALALEKQLKHEARKSHHTPLHITRLGRHNSDPKASHRGSRTPRALSLHRSSSPRSSHSPVSRGRLPGSRSASGSLSIGPSAPDRASMEPIRSPLGISENVTIRRGDSPQAEEPDTTTSELSELKSSPDEPVSTPTTSQTRPVEQVLDLPVYRSTEYPIPEISVAGRELEENLANLSLETRSSTLLNSRPPSPSLHSTRSSLVSRSKDMKDTFKATMMKLVFISGLKRKRAEPLQPRQTHSSSTLLKPSNDSTAAVGSKEIRNGIASMQNLHAELEESRPSQDTNSDASALAGFYLPTRHQRPVSQISQISAISQLSQYSTGSQLSSAAASQFSPDQASTTPTGSRQSSVRPSYGRTSTSSSFSSLISRHRKTGSKASSTSSASLKSEPTSPRRVASPLPVGRGSPRGRFMEAAVHPVHALHGRSRHTKRRTPFLGISYGKGSSSRTHNSHVKRNNVIEEDEEGEEELAAFEDDAFEESERTR